MAKRKRERVARHEAKSAARAPASLASVASRRRVSFSVVGGLMAAVMVVGFGYLWLAPRSPVPLSAPVPTPSATRPEASFSLERAAYVGAAPCAQCHPSEFKAWSGSHHQLAMQEANGSTVLGDFDNAKFKYNDVETVFFKRDGKYFVRTDGPNGKLADYQISYTFGVAPLQQYLIAFPGGRYQALSIAWDTRPKAEGGQRWFHLYPNDKIDHTDQRHWTGIYQNWNLQCAECHSTNLHKGFDAAANVYRTTFSEINVACEACHGPGSRHVGWAQRATTSYAPTDDKGLAVRLQSRWNEGWHCTHSDAKVAERDQPGPLPW